MDAKHDEPPNYDVGEDKPIATLNARLVHVALLPNPLTKMSPPPSCLPLRLKKKNLRPPLRPEIRAPPPPPRH